MGIEVLIRCREAGVRGWGVRGMKIKDKITDTYGSYFLLLKMGDLRACVVSVGLGTELRAKATIFF